MPPVAAGAILSGFIAGSTLSAIAFSWTAFAGSLILGGLSYALTPKPKSSSAGQGVQPGTVAVRQPDLTRTYTYGHTRVVRGYAHMESTNSNKDLHLILMLTQGPLRAINEIWVNDYCIPNDWIDVNGNVTQGRYKDYLKVYKHLGATDQLADAQAVLNMPNWTVNHRLQGIAYLYLVMIKNQDVYPTGVPNITAIVEGPLLYDYRISAPRWSTSISLFATDYILKPYGFASTAADVDGVNLAAQANICDEIVTVTNEPFEATAVDAATDIITLAGDLLTLQFGDRVRVSTTGTLPTGLSAGTDYYVIPYQIKDKPRLLLATTFNNSMDKVQIDLTTAGSGVMTVTKTGEPRYHGAGVIDTERTLAENLNNICNSMAGRAINIAGKWTLLAGAWRTPSVQLGIGDMRGSGLSWKNGLSMSDSANIVKGLFNGPATYYQDIDYPSARYQTFIDQDLGVEAPKDINLLMTSRPTTAQRIAKIELFRFRQDIGASCDFSMKAMQCQPGDVVGITMDHIGWDEKNFELTQFTFDANPQGLFTKTTLRETAQEIYDWSAGEAIFYDPAPNTTLTNAYDVLAPSGVAYNSRITDTVQGDQFATLQLEWDLHPDAFVREYGQFELQFRLSNPANGPEDNWSPGFMVSGRLTSSDVVTASIGTYYDLRIRAINNIGVRSGWSPIYEAIVGSSGGVTTTDDWGLASATPGVFKDWGAASSTPTFFEDWGFA